MVDDRGKKEEGRRIEYTKEGGLDKREVRLEFCSVAKLRSMGRETA